MKRSEIKGKRPVVYITQVATIAAMYTVFTLISFSMGLSSGAIQVRISEALCVLALYTSAAVPGLTIGCFISNLLTVAPIYDIIFGSLATFIGVYATYLIRNLAKKYKSVKYISPLPTVISNAVIIPLVLKYAYGVEEMIPYLVLTVGAGEVISAWILGAVLICVIDRRGPERLGLK